MERELQSDPRKGTSLTRSARPRPASPWEDNKASYGCHSGCLGVMGICVAREHQCAETTVTCDSGIANPHSNLPPIKHESREEVVRLDVSTCRVCNVPHFELNLLKRAQSVGLCCDRRLQLEPVRTATGSGHLRRSRRATRESVAVSAT